MYIQMSETMYYALLEPDMDFIFKERGRFNVKASNIGLHFAFTHGSIVYYFWNLFLPSIITIISVPVVVKIASV